MATSTTTSTTTAVTTKGNQLPILSLDSFLVISILDFIQTEYKN